MTKIMIHTCHLMNHEGIIMKSLLLLGLFSCGPKHNFAGKNFVSSDSLCLDALIVNIEADGCKNIEAITNEEKKTLKIYCDDEKVDGDSPWLNHIFYFSSTILPGKQTPGLIICSDPSLTMTFQKRYQDEK
jgi:hypothetical protein